jgi:hypothetical protein
MDITPGKTVCVEIAKLPTNAAATKTLIRLFRKDPEVSRFQRRQGQNRPSWQTWRRGGRTWHHQMKTKPPFTLTTGRQLSILATVDIIRDIESVERWVTVTSK